MTPGERIQAQVIIDVAAGETLSLNNVGTTNESLVDHFQNVQFSAETLVEELSPAPPRSVSCCNQFFCRAAPNTAPESGSEKVHHSLWL